MQLKILELEINVSADDVSTLSLFCNLFVFCRCKIAHHYDI
jgi:hypothetical protein